MVLSNESAVTKRYSVHIYGQIAADPGPIAQSRGSITRVAPPSRPIAWSPRLAAPAARQVLSSDRRTATPPHHDGVVTRTDGDDSSLRCQVRWPASRWFDRRAATSVGERPWFAGSNECSAHRIPAGRSSARRRSFAASQRAVDDRRAAATTSRRAGTTPRSSAARSPKSADGAPWCDDHDAEVRQRYTDITSSRGAGRRPIAELTRSRCDGRRLRAEFTLFQQEGSR